MKLLLVYPEIESSNTNTSTYSLPLGLGSIGTYCRKYGRESLEVKILDGSFVTHEEQMAAVRQFSPDVTGINPTIASQKNAYAIGQAAKEQGSLVIFGGVNSTNLWKNMLKNRTCIDGIVLYDGEVPMHLVLNRLPETKILGKNAFMGIPNLAYRDADKNIQEPSSIYIPALGDLPDIDYSLFDLARFFEETERKGFGKAVTYYAGKGCAKRGGVNLKHAYSLEEYGLLVSSMDICTFCGRNDLGLRNLAEERETGIIKRLHEVYGVTGFFNVQDTVHLRNASSLDLPDAWFRLFIGAESITPDNVHRLQQRYGKRLIFQVGVEAANPQMRHVFGKKETDREDLTAKVELLRDEGIELHASFILGGRGETKGSMLRTTAMARELAGYENVTWILISPQLILPGSPDYHALLQMPRMRKKYAGEDILDIVEINTDFLRQFAPDVTREEIVEEIKRTFDDIRNLHGVFENGRKLVLDVKGVVDAEEEHITPRRPYTQS